ncbi:nuclear transport factor 2 family protein [Cupriavidus sp. RAF12]|uniref:nuclear transport factor 2 family protein n=1 Tax=Cupriavidus sp. RAF12 TaxID=3233050 RepID=UPI003F92674B
MATPKEIVQGTYDAYRRQDIQAVLDVLSPDVSWKMVGQTRHIRYAGERTSLADIANVFEHMAADDDIKRFEDIEIIEAANGKDITVLGVVEGVVRQTGKPYTLEWAHVFTVENEKITRWIGFYDTAVRLECS